MFLYKGYDIMNKYTLSTVIFILFSYLFYVIVFIRFIFSCLFD